MQRIISRSIYRAGAVVLSSTARCAASLPATRARVSALPMRAFASAAAAAAGASGGGSVVEFDESTSSMATILKKERVIAYYTASWCGPCRAIKPVFEALASTHGDKIAFVRVDVDSNGATADQAGIKAVPTFKVYKDGKELRQFSGANTQLLRSVVDDLIAQ